MGAPASRARLIIWAILVTVCLGGAIATKIHFDAIEPSEYAGPSLAPPPSVARVGDAIPAMALHDLNGATIDLGGPLDHTRLVHFWASWCLPCVAELPSLDAAQSQFKKRSIELVTVAMDDSAHAQEVVDRLHLHLTVLVADGAPFDPLIAMGSNQGTVPYNATVDESGTLVARSVGTKENGATGLLKWLDEADFHHYRSTN